MSNQELIERYVYAVVRKLPYKMQQDVSLELKGLIDDMLAERVMAGVELTIQDIKVVLTELGSPTDLAMKYSPSRDRVLIGAKYFPYYIFVLKIVIPAVIFGLLVSNILSGLMDGERWYIILGSTALSIITGLMMASAIVTLIFAIFEWKNIDISSSEKLESLPSVPKKEERIGRVGPIVEIIFSLIFSLLILLAPELFSVFHFGQGGVQTTPVFNLSTLHSIWYLFVLLFLVGNIKSIMELIEGRYTMKLMATTIVTNLGIIVLSILWVTSPNLMNPAFIIQIDTLITDSEFVLRIFHNAQYYLLGFIIFGIVIDSTTVIYKTLKYTE